MLSLQSFGEKLRNLREEKRLLLRELATLLDIDNSTLSKIERNERKPNYNLINKLSKILETDGKDLYISFASDKVVYELLQEENSIDILKVAEEKIMYIKNLKNNSPNKDLISKNNTDLENIQATQIQKPFLKWAGGKTQLIPQLMKLAPSKFGKYIEPFVGGGALYFNINHKESIISDLNEELIIAYKEVKANVFEVISILESYSNTEEFYYKIRAISPTSISNSERAARLIYLNKTCFNGLFRVNKKGEFNVPYGKRTCSFLNVANLISASKCLQQTEIYFSDYKEILKKFAKKGDFIFLDPPYQPIGKYSDFKRYTKEFFYEKDQVELANVFTSLVKKGCHVMLTNSNHPLILEMYKDFNIEILQTKRLISSNSNTRTGKDIIVLGGI